MEIRPFKPFGSVSALTLGGGGPVSYTHLTLPTTYGV